MWRRALYLGGSDGHNQDEERVAARMPLHANRAPTPHAWSATNPKIRGASPHPQPVHEDTTSLMSHGTDVVKEPLGQGHSNTVVQKTVILFS